MTCSKVPCRPSVGMKGMGHSNREKGIKYCEQILLLDLHALVG